MESNKMPDDVKSESKTITIPKANPLYGSIMLITTFSLFHFSQFFFYFLIYVGYVYKMYWIWIILGSIYAYQLSPYCVKQQWFVNLMNASAATQFFRAWSYTEEEPIQKQKAMIGAHPHGILDFGVLINGPLFYPNFFILGSRVILSFPLNGMFMRWIGGKPVNAANMKKMLKKGQNFALIPGGFEEATLTSTNQCRVFIKNRKGFIKYAMQNGYSVYPLFVFGENQLYSVFEPFLKLRLYLNKFKLPGVLFGTRYGMYPSSQAALHTVVGKAISFTPNPNPTQDQIDEGHKQYVEELKRIFYKYREQFGEKSDLIIY